MNLHRPEPLLRTQATPVSTGTPPALLAARLLDGEVLGLQDRYRVGMDALAALHAALKPPPDDAHYPVRRAFRRDYRQAALRLIAPVDHHRVGLPDAPVIGLFPELYPDIQSFYLPFLQVQELNKAWNWYRKGVHFAVLGRALHVFYGVYAPSRTEHLELFATWLSQYRGPRAHAVDVGTGSGILAFMLCKAGFEQVLATDINPNAVLSVQRELEATPLPLTVEHTDLLGKKGELADVIVFNPPWMQGEIEDELDRALYFQGDLFARFFERAHARLKPTGRVVLVFSNVLQLVQPNSPHPIEIELSRGKFSLVQKLTRKIKGSGRVTKERVEVWELARV